MRVDPAGSREIATSVDLRRYDFAFPSSSPAAQKIQRQVGVTTAYAPFYSPMAIATSTPIMGLLSQQGVAKKDADGQWVVDVARYLDLAGKGTRWDQLLGNTAYPVRKDVLINTTDPRDSNSAAMHTALISYVANGDAVVRDPGAENKVLPLLTRLFLAQGGSGSTSADPFDDYLASGMSRPMVLVYEAQFLDRVMRADGSIKRDMVLAYPSPTVLSKHTLVPLPAGGGKGDKVGQLLMSDPDLQRRAAAYGFRATDSAYFARLAAERRVPAPKSLTDVVDPPAYETLEHLLAAIEKAYT